METVEFGEGIVGNNICNTFWHHRKLRNIKLSEALCSRISRGMAKEFCEQLNFLVQNHRYRGLFRDEAKYDAIVVHIPSTEKKENIKYMVENLPNVKCFNVGGTLYNRMGNTVVSQDKEDYYGNYIEYVGSTTPTGYGEDGEMEF